MPESVRKFIPPMKEMDFINIWYSKRETTSNWHYDSYDNFLCTLKGTKRFYILPPNDFKPYLKYESVLTDMYNQADETMEISHTGRRGLRRKLQTVIIRENEALYLPKGWHHKVSSFGEKIVAIKFWFRSVERCSLASSLNKEFIWRYITHEIIEQRVKEFLRAHYDSIQTRDHIDLLKNTRKKYKKIEEAIDSADSIFRYLFKTPAWKIRGFLEEISTQKEELLDKFLKNLNEKNIELLVKRLEEIDKKFLVWKPFNIAEIYAEFSRQEEAVDDFYSVWRRI